MLLLLLLLMGLGTLVLSIPAVQTAIARYATNTLNNNLGTHIVIDRVGLSLFTLNTRIRGIYIEDYKKDTLVYVQRLNTSILNLSDIAAGNLQLGTVALEGVYVNLKTYKGEAQTNLEVFVEKVANAQARPPDAAPFCMTSDRIGIMAGRFTLTNENLERAKVLHFTDLRLAAEDFKITGAEVSATLSGLGANTHWGLAVEDFSTRFTYTNTHMHFEALHLHTRQSQLQGNVVFEYKQEDLKAFVDRVTLTAEITASKIALGDLNTFYPVFGIDKAVLFSGQVSGTLNRLNVNNLVLQSENTGIYGDFEFVDLFSRQAPFKIQAEIEDLTSSYEQLRDLLPGVLGTTIPEAVQRLGVFTVVGQTKVTETALKAQVTISTAIGKGHTDLEITDLKSRDNASYKGFLSLIDFDLAALTGNTQLGRTAVELQVAGTGFSTRSLNTRVVGKVYQLHYNTYDYKDIKVSGVFRNQLFNGTLASDDENFTFCFKGLADFGEKEHQFNFKASVAHADLRRLNFTKDSISIFKGEVSLNVRGTTLDNMAGQLQVSDATYQNKKQTYYFEDFAITSTFNADTVRTVQINSPDIITGYLKGKFKVNEIGKLFQNAVGSLYSHYKPFTVAQGQYLDFNFSIYNKIVELFLPQVALDPNTFIKGELYADKGDVSLTFTSPRIEAFGNTFTALALQVANSKPRFTSSISIGAVATKYYTLKDVSLSNITRQDTLFFQVQAKGGPDAADRYNLNLYHTFNEAHKSVVGVKKSSLTFKGNTWLLNKNNTAKNKVIFNKTLDSITIEEMVMDHNNTEQLRLRGQLADSTYKDIDLAFQHVSLSKIMPTLDSLKLNGIVEGSVQILQKQGKYLPTADVGITDLKVNTLRLGDLEIGIFGNNDFSRFVLSTWLEDKGEEKMRINGNITNADEGQQLALFANVTNFALEPFRPLGGRVISNLRGMLNGSFTIGGELFNPALSGALTLDEAGMGISYLNVDYNLAPYSRIRLSDQTFYLEDIQLSEAVEGTTATLAGSITHRGFTDWLLNLNVDTHSNRFMILNTSFKEEALYYGTAFINGTGSIYGPTDALTITVDAATVKGTSLKIPLSDVTTVGDYSFITFTEKEAAQVVKKERVLKDYSGLEMAFDLAVTPDAEIVVVVDRDSGSSLKGTGEGILLIEINTNGKFNMYGDFVVVTGLYNLKYGGVIDKTFTVRPGGNILWEGNPLEGQLNLQAVYALNANPAPLLDNPGFTGRIPTEVVVRLDGVLKSPNIGFDIDFPTASSVVQSEVAYRLQDPTLKEQNAFSLLAQGAFWGQQTELDGRQIAIGNAVQTASGLLNQILEGSNDKFNLGVSYEQGVLDPNTDVRTEDRIGVTVSTQLSDRILVNGRVGVPVGGVSETVVAGDVEVQVLLNEKGTLSAKIFNRENQIQQFLTEQQGYIQGAGLSYQVDFNTFRELLQKIVQKKKDKTAFGGTAPTPRIMEKNGSLRFVPKNREQKGKEFTQK